MTTSEKGSNKLERVLEILQGMENSYKELHEEAVRKFQEASRAPGIDRLALEALQANVRITQACYETARSMRITAKVVAE